MLRRLFVQKEIQFHAAAAARVPPLRRSAILPGQRGNAQSRQRLAVQGEDAFTRRHQHVPQVIRIDRLHLEDPGIVGARRSVGALHQFHAFGECRFGGRSQDGVEIVAGTLIQIELVHFAWAGGDVCRHPRGFANLLRRKVVAVRVAGPLAGDYANSDPHGNTLGRAFNHRFVNTDPAG